MSEGGQATLGGIYILGFIGLVVVLIVVLEKKYGAKIRAKQRDREIETAMRLGMVDGEAQDRIARKIIEEKSGYSYFDNE